MENMTKTRVVGVVEKAVASGLSLADNHHELVIQDIMSSTIISVDAETTVAEAARIMSYHMLSVV